jgi:hypothetical protein
MSNKELREHLDTLSKNLTAWKQATPDYAREFHRCLDSLLADIAGERKRWNLSEERVQALNQEFAVIYKIFKGLSEFIEERKKLQSALNALRTQFEHERPHVAEYGRARCDAWTEQLDKVAGCRREVDLTGLQRSLGECKDAVSKDAEILRQFHRADTLLRSDLVQRGIDTGLLDNELGAQREALVQNRVDPDGLNRIKSYCKAIEDELNKPAPPEIKQLTKALPEIRKWREALSGESSGQREGWQLREDSLKQRQLQIDKTRRLDPDEPKKLFGEANALLVELTQKAGEIRSEKQDRLTGLLTELILACGRDGDAEETERLLEQLRRFPVETANDHIDWLADFESATVQFNATAANNKDDLKQRLDALILHLQEDMGVLQNMTLSQDIRLRSNKLDLRIDALNDTKGSRDLLASLSDANACRKELDGLTAQAKQARRDFDGLRERLERINKDLQSLAQKSGIGCEDLAADIAKLGFGADYPDLDEALVSAQDLQDRFAAVSLGFIDSCHQLLRQNQEDLDQLANGLREAGYPADEPLADPVPADAGACVALLTAQSSQRQNLEERLGEAIADQTLRHHGESEKLRAWLSNGAWEPEHQERASGLLYRLETDIHAETNLQRLEELSALLRDCTSFWEDIQEKQQGLQQWLESLKRQLNAFGHERLKDYCPEEYLRRADEWLRALPVQPKREHERQMEEAQLLLHRLELHARRRIAEEVRRQVGELAQHKHRRPELVADADLLLEAIQHNHDIPPSYPRRKRLAEMHNAVNPGVRHRGKP